MTTAAELHKRHTPDYRIPTIAFGIFGVAVVAMFVKESIPFLQSIHNESTDTNQPSVSWTDSDMSTLQGYCKEPSQEPPLPPLFETFERSREVFSHCIGRNNG